MGDEHAIKFGDPGRNPNSYQQFKIGKVRIMKNPQREGVVIMARCSHSNQPFGITMEKKGDGAWHCLWAFKLTEGSATSEGYSNEMISGKVVTDPEFPGCPHCGAKGWFSCECGKLTCLDGASSTATCAWCGASGELVQVETMNLQGGGY